MQYVKMFFLFFWCLLSNSIKILYFYILYKLWLNPFFYNEPTVLYGFNYCDLWNSTQLGQILGGGELEVLDILRLYDEHLIFKITFPPLILTERISNTASQAYYFTFSYHYFRPHWFYAVKPGFLINQ